MLDQETKRQINACRDIFVGKVPDPKSQVEQITIALIYKFMDDMDKESVEMGGKASFFTGKYKKYSWTNIFDPRIGGHELTRLYGEAIEGMNQNPNIPQLFRDIFKNAYLPYRDPETLKLFLKEISHFEYSHSEKLGDAFEYLLSFMGTQGDAGQFRTPRHIIDFIVAAVNPQKHETVLDPACGTAGFLISAYKHILKANSENPPNGREGGNGNQLTPTERKRLLTNFTGYDISPDMVRLSLVNLYLHGFQDPKILEYDTLTSEERWNETVDVMLANPPFMTPKGGIRPHKRFSVQAKRSEVLFVDYIAEHLNPGGRAGVIVPEGIIFQSSNAYKALRKMLVEDYLWAVVSLPAGVFNPYSGVKTSILLIDKNKAKQSDSILFIKVENDGFDLGAQRRPIDKNDLPEALKILESPMESINRVDGDEEKNALTRLKQSKSEIAHWVEKSKIAESGDWNLSGERYRVNDDLRMSNYELKKFDEVCTLEYGASLPKKNRIVGKYPVVGSNGITGWHNEYLIDSPAIVVGRKGSAGEVTFIDSSCFPIDTTYYIKTVNGVEINFKYLFHILTELDLPALKGGAGIPGLNRNDVYEMRKIPLPPLSVQEEIVAEIDGYQKIIDGARQVVDNYKPTIKINPDWEMVALGEVSNIISGYAFKSSDFSNTNKIKSVKITNAGVRAFSENGGDLLPEGFENKYKNYTVNENDLVIALTRSIISTGLKVCRVPKSYDGALVNQRVAGIKEKPNISDINFIYNYLCTPVAYKFIKDKSKSLMQPNLSVKDLAQFPIPLPPLSVQQEIVAQIEAEQEMVNANKKLIEIYEQKIKDKIGEVWGE
ncbi:MAG: N-6 DNA methylase [Candidatus Marinimicrobia bacterium]|nr:N-6 DNA methylase [Candidatus Neomarinimicrobiota bacterium]